MDVVGMSWLTQLYNVVLRSEAVPLDWQTGVVAPILKGDLGVCSNYGGTHSSVSLGRSIAECWKGECICESNLGYRRNNAVFILVVEHWTRQFSPCIIITRGLVLMLAAC